MEQASASKAVAVEVTDAEYEAAALLAARRVGALRSLPLVLGVGILLLLAGLGSFPWFWGRFGSALIPAILCVAGPLVIVLFLCLTVKGIKKEIAADRPVYQKLMQDATLRFAPDGVDTETAVARLHDPYALMVALVETPELLVFIKDRERFLVLPNRCIPAGEREALLEFLRLTFIRKRRVMKSWWL